MPSPTWKAVLIAASWAGFVGAGLVGVAVLPRLGIEARFSEREFVLASEAWWRSRPDASGLPTLVVLSGGGCGCSPGAAAQRLQAEASAVGIKVLLIEAASGPHWDLAAAPPPGSGIDMLLFDRQGHLRMGLLGDNPEHCLAASARLRAGLATDAAAQVWPGLCHC